VNEEVGMITNGLHADLIVVEGDPSSNIADLRKIMLVMKEGVIYLNKQTH
jgi:imidazolonepropionase-like amidohydrolase